MNKSNWKLTLAKKVVAGITAIAVSYFSNTDPANSAP